MFRFSLCEPRRVSSPVVNVAMAFMAFTLFSSEAAAQSPPVHYKACYAGDKTGTIYRIDDPAGGYPAAGAFPVSNKPNGCAVKKDSVFIWNQIGPQGPQGVAGPQGSAGATGLQGAVGATGLQGATGPSGPQGPLGLEGRPGAEGAPGPVGAQGPSGVTGLQGPPGPAGVDGAPGAVGAQGPAGTTGLQGRDGPAGADGASGATGAAGADGAAGATGATGAAGAVGPAGPQGPAGLSGFLQLDITVSVGAFASLPVTIACPLGKTAISGGFLLDTDLFMEKMFPNNDGGTSNYTFSVVNKAGSPRNAKVFASCALISS